MDLGFIGHQPCQDASESQGVLAQGRSDPVVAGRRRVALVEDEVDHLQDGCEAGLKIGALRDLERNVGLGQRPFRAHDPLADRGLRDKERSGDLVCTKPSQETQRQGDPRIHRQHRVAADEHQPEQVVADRGIVDRGVEIRGGPLVKVEVAPQLFRLALERGSPAHGVDRPMLGRAHQPGRRTIRDAGIRPLADRGFERVLGEILGQADVPDDPSQRCNEPGRLHPPHRVQDTVDLVFPARGGLVRGLSQPAVG